MRLEKRSGGATERTVVTGMLVSTSVLSRLAAKWDKKEGMLRSPWANLVGGWAVDYFARYGKAPGANVEGLYEAWSASDNRDKETVKLVETFLSGLDGEYKLLKKRTNPDYVVDLAAAHFTEVKADRLLLALQGDRDAGKLDDFQKRLARFTMPQVGSQGAVDLFTDEAQVKDTFLEKRESIVKYPGALGRMLGDELERDAFVAFMAPEKRGKTWWLMDLAWRAMLQRRRVAFFQIGDLSLRQMKRRFLTRVSGRPVKPTPKDKPVWYPTKLEFEDGVPDVAPVEKKWDTWLDGDAAWRACQKLMTDKVKSKDSYFKLFTYPARTLTMKGLRADLLQLQRQDGWSPDVVVIDYADLFAPPAGFQGDSRDATNVNWMDMRALSQERSCLVATATQAKAASYTAESLDMTHFSEDKRKFAHVTLMLGINQTDKWKEAQVQSLNVLVMREDEFVSTRHCYVAGCLPLANPCVLSSF